MPVVSFSLLLALDTATGAGWQPSAGMDDVGGLLCKSNDQKGTPAQGT